MKIDLEFNLESLRISDLPEDEQENNGATSRGSSSIIESIKARSTIQGRIDEDGVIQDPTQGVGLGKVRANVESSKMREILNKQFGDED